MDISLSSKRGSNSPVVLVPNVVPPIFIPSFPPARPELFSNRLQGDYGAKGAGERGGRGGRKGVVRVKTVAHADMVFVHIFR